MIREWMCCVFPFLRCSPTSLETPEIDESLQIARDVRDVARYVKTVGSVPVERLDAIERRLDSTAPRQSRSIIGNVIADRPREDHGA
jgi:hypothetical protein